MKPIDLRAAGLSDKPEDWPADLRSAPPRHDSVYAEGTAALDAPVADPVTGELPWSGPGIVDGRIVSMVGLDYMGDQLAGLERGIAENEELHDAAVRRLVERLETVQAPLRRERARAEAMIRAYAEELGQKALCIGRAKTRRLPGSGLTLAWRTLPETLRLRDGLEHHEALLKWAKSRPPEECLVRTKESPDLQNIKRYVRAWEDPQEPRFTPPGMERIPASESLSVGIEKEEIK